MTVAHAVNICDNRDYRSSRICDLRDRYFCDTRKYGVMNDPQYDFRVWIQEQLARLGHGAKGALAKHLGVRPDAVTRMINTDPVKESREIKAHELEAIRSFFAAATDAPEVATVNVPLMGYVGAGAEIEPDYEQVPDDGLEQIAVPFDLPDDMIAFQVRGDSMLPQFRDGLVIIVYREQRRPLHSFYGEEALVRTDAGRRFIKTIERGADGGVNLMSWNARPIENVRIEWVGEIFTYFPYSIVRRVAKQGGIQGRLRLQAGE